MRERPKTVESYAGLSKTMLVAAVWQRRIKEGDDPMPWFEYIWTPAIEAHLAENGVTREEFQEVVSSSGRPQQSRSSDRPLKMGFTSEGRHLACVYEQIDAGTILPVTAYEIDESN